VARGDTPVVIRGTKQRTLLCVLLAHANQRVSTDRLIDALWGPERVDGALHLLQVHVSNLRKALEPDHRPGRPWEVIETVEDGYRLGVEPGHDDRAVFETLAGEGRAQLEAGECEAAAATLRDALELWRGAPFSDLAADDALRAETVRLEELHLAVIQGRVEAELDLGRHVALIGELRDLVDAYPFDERLRGSLMLALYRAGRQEEALRSYRSFERLLGEELGVIPGPEIRALEEKILLQDASLDLDVPARPTPTNLPAATSSFIGRERDVERAHELHQRARLVTFTGPGGVGKTQLAIAAAAALTDKPADGIWVVELAALRDDTLVGNAVAGALAIDEQPGRPTANLLAERLRDASMLLIVDNCEHLLEGVAVLVETLLRTCPSVRVWATSREPLGIAGENRLAVSGLRFPADDTAQVAELARYEAVQLFVDRASAAVAGFELTPANGTAVAQICSRLDGNPLAIQLAAARVQLLTPPEIAAGLDDRFSLLTSGSRTAQDRQRTLKATLDWSYDLLTSAEQAMLRRLSIFRGSFDLDAVGDVCGSIGGAGPLELLDGLVAKSLVAVDRSGTTTRYRLLDTVRAYARAALVESGEESDVASRHRSWYLALAETAGRELRGADQLAWLERLEANRDDLLAALERAYAADDIDAALRIAGSLAWFWFLHSHFDEGRQWLERLLARRSEGIEALRARVLIAAGQFAWEQSNDAQAERWLGEALDIARRIGSRTLQAWAGSYLALLAVMEGRWDDGRRHAGGALELFSETGNLGGVGFATWLGVAATYLEARQLGIRGNALAGTVDQIQVLVTLAQQVGDRNFLGHLVWSLAISSVDDGDFEAAGRHLRVALEAFRELGNKSCAAHAIDEVARLALAAGQPKRAARLLGATDALRATLGIPGHVLEQRSWEACFRQATDLLGPGDCSEAMADGALLSFDEAVEDALAGLAPSAATGHRSVIRR